MCCPTLSELPSPPLGRTGWPWTEESPQLPDTMPDGKSWPRISIVTPSYNQGQFNEETIRSVLLQGYPDLEYMVIDGGSTDDSVEIIRRYEQWLTYWVSEPDRGQSHAIEKGLVRATGEVFNWINSDDLLTPGALARVALTLGGADLVAGACLNFAADGPKTLVISAALSARNLVRGSPQTIYQQPATWLKREAVWACGGIDPRFHFAFDWDLTIRYLHRFPRVAYTPSVLAWFRLHPRSKTQSAWEQFGAERLRILAKLRDLPDAGELATECDRRLRQYAWWHVLDRMVQDRSASPWRRVATIMFHACHDPRIRWSRLTLGAIRRCWGAWAG